MADGIGTRDTELVSQLIKSGAIKEFGDVAGAWGHALAEQYAGEDAGFTAESAIDGAVTGLIAGTMMSSTGAAGAGAGAVAALAIPGGAIIAGVAILGGLLGAVRGIAKAQEKRNQAFNGYTGGKFQMVRQTEREQLERGIALNVENTEGAFFQTNQAWQEFQDRAASRRGEGYETQRSMDIQENISRYDDSGLDNALAALDRDIGMGEAYQVGLSEAYTREALALLTLGEETDPKNRLITGEGAEQMEGLRTRYVGLEQAMAGAKQTGDREKQAILAEQMSGLKEETLALAGSMYQASEVSLRAQDAELELAASIRKITKAIEGDRNHAYALEQVQGGADVYGFLSDGRKEEQRQEERERQLAAKVEIEAELQKYGNNYFRTRSGPMPIQPVEAEAGMMDFGNSNFRTRAYPGNPPAWEAVPVVFADSGKQQKTPPVERGDVQINFSGPVTVREEADLDKLARKLAAEVLRAKVLAAP